MALIVFGVVLQQPPMREAPASCHLFTYDMKSMSETPVDFYKHKIVKKQGITMFHKLKLDLKTVLYLYFVIGSNSYSSS